MLEVGLNATRNTIGFPLEMPPLTPPAPLPEVMPEGETIGSLCSEPFIPAALNPAPNSMPLTPGMEKTICEISDSTESKNGSPSPTGTFPTVHSTIPPTESPSAMALSSMPDHKTVGSVTPGLSTSDRGTPPISTREASTENMREPSSGSCARPYPERTSAE